MINWMTITIGGRDSQSQHCILQRPSVLYQWRGRFVFKHRNIIVISSYGCNSECGCYRYKKAALAKSQGTGGDLGSLKQHTLSVVNKMAPFKRNMFSLIFLVSLLATSKRNAFCNVEFWRNWYLTSKWPHPASCPDSSTKKNLCGHPKIQRGWYAIIIWNTVQHLFRLFTRSLVPIFLIWLV